MVLDSNLQISMYRPNLDQNVWGAENNFFFFPLI